MEYYKVFIQKEEKDAVVMETVADFDIWCADIPFDIGMNVKEPAVRDWQDEDGEDSYTGGGLMMSAYDMTVKWCCKGKKFSANDKIRKFINYLNGRDGSGVKMKMYCDWTRTGRQHIRLKNVGRTAGLYRRDDGDVVTFETVLRVEDPITEIELKKEEKK